MISGRGLGITGGTLDKLESIPGFTTKLEPRRIIEQTQALGVAMAGQTETMVPADKKLYALRDVSGTVPSIPLITASILSKKLAEGLDALVMDVKFGTAAFMQTRDQARALAESIVSLSRSCGVKTSAMLTDMNTPLGRAAGNWLEVKESIECLEGRGPADLQELVIACAAQLLVLTARAPSPASAAAQAKECLASGAPLRKWDELVAAQGGDVDAVRRKMSAGPSAPVIRELKAERSGCITRCDARIIGELIRDLGGGRLTKESVIQPDVGVDQLAKPGEIRKAGEVLCRIHASTASDAEMAATRLASAFTIAEEPPPLEPLIRDVV
jgi:pyrimidine-nucleoside phosphorylase